MQIGIGIGVCSMVGGSLDAQIAALFASGEQGEWYDPSDWSTLFQDSADTTPVTAVGQPVGKMLDKSGRGNHATQPTAINRPVLQQDASGRYYLAFNGTNSWMSTSAIDFTATDKMMACAGVKKLNDAAAFGVVAELSTITATNNGSFLLMAPGASAVQGYGLENKGSATRTTLTTSAYPAPHSAVLTFSGDISGDASTLRVNGATATQSSADLGTGNYGNYPLYIGSRAGSTIFFNGQLYSLIIRGAASTNVQISAAEKFINSKTGAY